MKAKDFSKVYGSEDKYFVYINNEKKDISNTAKTVLTTNFGGYGIDSVDDSTYFTLADYTNNRTGREIVEVAGRCEIKNFTKSLNGVQISGFACVLDDLPIYVYAEGGNRVFSYEKEKAKEAYKMLF